VIPWIPCFVAYYRCLLLSRCIAVHSLLPEVEALGLSHGLGAALYSQFAAEVQDMLLDRVHTEDQSLASLFSTRGQPAEAPWRLAMVCIFQFIEGLTDRQAAEAVQQGIDWKYALALEFSDPGFDFSMLSKFRARLITGGSAMQLFEVLLKHLKTHGLLIARGRQRTDSTHILAAVRALNRMERVGETLRHALNILAEVAPDWLRAHSAPEWYERYGRRMENYRFPKAETERQTFGATIGEDSFALVRAIDAEESAP
jgi:transposase